MTNGMNDVCDSSECAFNDRFHLKRHLKPRPV